MKKEELLENLEQTGHTINDLYSRAWSTALYPTQHGWGPALGCIVAIPVLSMASFGRMVGTAIVEQLPPSLFDQPGDSGKSDKP